MPGIRRCGKTRSFKKRKDSWIEFSCRRMQTFCNLRDLVEGHESLPVHRTKEVDVTQKRGMPLKPSILPKVSKRDEDNTQLRERDRARETDRRRETEGRRRHVQSTATVDRKRNARGHAPRLEPVQTQHNKTHRCYVWRGSVSLSA